MDEAPDVHSIVADILESIERKGDSSALDAACDKYPELAQSIRDAVGQLSTLGLVKVDGAYPSRLGGYRLIHAVGEGGMGVSSGNSGGE